MLFQTAPSLHSDSGLRTTQDSKPTCPQFDKRIKFDSIPKEGQTWVSLCVMGQFSKARLVKPQSQYMTEPGQYWVVKRCQNQKNLDAWKVYQCLNQLEKLKLLTPLLWVAMMADSSDAYLVCSALEGMYWVGVLHENELVVTFLNLLYSV
ncbi:hypothetical protein RRG08_005098 [Elysia crispata]|uniref:Uncharacterized protein n=1 Tax=Elysia crispata TaxID=231223 RepID=A0AAE0XZI1_9GAST|nr:hypothetical protein RRG08_005098 [Elysia crispata]